MLQRDLIGLREILKEKQIDQIKLKKNKQIKLQKIKQNYLIK